VTRTSTTAGGTVPPVVGGRYRPVLGLRRNAVQYAEAMWREHGDVVRLRLGPPGLDREMWMFHHPDAAARIFSGSTWRSFAKEDPVHEEISRWLGTGLLTAEGEEWTSQRRFLQPLFTHAAVDGYADLMVEEILHVVEEWDVTAEPVTDLGEQMQRLTLRVAVAALFGDSADRVIPHVRRSFPVVSDTIIRRGLGAVRLPAGIPTPRVRRGRVARDELLGACEEIVGARRAGRSSGETDLLSRLLAAQELEGRLGDEEVRGQVLTFLLAGHETTSTALTFALHLLGRHPEVQDGLRDEVRTVVGDGRPTAAATASLPLTTAVLKETMRLYPSAPFLGRLTVADDEVLGHPVAAGTTVVVPPWTVHRHPDVWPDPLCFDPSRFTPEAEHRRHRYAWMPFGGGPRACIGQHFSMVEAVLALALVLREHRVTALADTAHVGVSSLITLFPTEPVLARVTRIS
jgi:cytochrome P450